MPPTLSCHQWLYLWLTSCLNEPTLKPCAPKRMGVLQSVLTLPVTMQRIVVCRHGKHYRPQDGFACVPTGRDMPGHTLLVFASLRRRHFMPCTAWFSTRASRQKRCFSGHASAQHVASSQRRMYAVFFILQAAIGGSICRPLFNCVAAGGSRMADPGCCGAGVDDMAAPLIPNPVQYDHVAPEPFPGGRLDRDI